MAPLPPAGVPYLAYITDDSTATSFRYLVDGKLHVTYMEGIDVSSAGAQRWRTAPHCLLRSGRCPCWLE